MSKNRPLKTHVKIAQLKREIFFLKIFTIITIRFQVIFTIRFQLDFISEYYYNVTITNLGIERRTYGNHKCTPTV